MSLVHIQNRRQPTIFGADLNVLIGDTTINGNLDIQGSINGTSSQGQNTNNTWTGTNEFSVDRPTCIPNTAVGNAGVNLLYKNQKLLAESIVNQGSTWTGENTFSQNVVLPTGITPTLASQGVPVQYVVDGWNAKNQSYLTANNTWTGSNTFIKVLPTCIDPVASNEIATKNYTDTTIKNVAQGDSSTILGQTSITNADWSVGTLAVEVQIIGGGGGSTSSVGTCVCSSAGVSGGSGSTGSLIVLTRAIAGTGKGLWSVSVGGGGGGGVGCGVGSGSGGGGSTNLYVTPNSTSGLNQTQVNILRANGGGGFGGTCGQAGTAGGGSYSNINPLVVAPFASSNGRNGTQCAGQIPQYSGINTFGWGARGASCANGAGGSSGGYGLVNFLG